MREVLNIASRGKRNKSYKRNIGNNAIEVMIVTHIYSVNDSHIWDDIFTYIDNIFADQFHTYRK